MLLLQGENFKLLLLLNQIIKELIKIKRSNDFLISHII